MGIVNLEDVARPGKGVEQIITQAGDDLGHLIENHVRERLNRAHADKAIMQDFRKSLQVLAEEVLRDPSSSDVSDQHAPPAGKKLVVIVDELDRCRPNFAMNVLERIKHIFSVRNVCFLLVANLAQLETIVRGAYGAELDAHTYMEKFYHIRLTLPEEDRADLRT